MYLNKFVVSLKVGEKFLKEVKDEIRLPYLSEYSIYIKNLENRNALVNVFIDGKDVLGGNRLIVYANSILELDGFMESNVIENRFRFIERTDKIENFRGINPEDSLVHVQFDFEKKKDNFYWGRYIPNITYTYNPTSEWYTYTYPNDAGQNSNMATWTLTNTIGGGGSGVSSSVFNINAIDNSQNNDVGITVKGENTYQPFGIGYVGELENNPSNIILKMKGFHAEENKDYKIFTKDEISCPTCGTVSKSNKKFCSECGTNIN